MSKMRLVIADVDGTLVTPDKELTKRARRAVLALRHAGIAFAVTSGRPPRGMSMLIGPLEITTPISGFNGGILVHPDLSPIEEQTLPISIVGQIMETIERHKLDVWVYRGADWFVRTLTAPHVAHEQRTVRFPPTLASSFDNMHEGIVKIVGIGDDPQAVVRCETDLREEFDDVSAARSQSYHLDVTHPNANKGAVVRRLSALLNVPTELIATMGDMPNDVLMFALTDLSIAMGNASSEVQRAARRVTGSNTEDGFADAVEKYILADSGSRRRRPRGAAASCHDSCTRRPMATKRFKRGDHVSWNSESGRVRGRITRVVTSPTKFKSYTVHANRDEPQYEIKSDTTDHIAMHKASALTKLRS